MASIVTLHLLMWNVRSLLKNSLEHAEAQQITFIDAAQQGGVKHIVKLSQFAADASSPVRFLRYYAAVEAALRSSGMTYTFLRPNLFLAKNRYCAFEFNFGGSMVKKVVIVGAGPCGILLARCHPISPSKQSDC